MEIRKDLLRNLLENRVTYEDVQSHKLSDEEIEILYQVDYISKDEFIYMYRRKHPGSHRSAAYKEWERKRIKLAKTFNEIGFDRAEKACDRLGMDMDMVYKGYKYNLPVYWYFSSYRKYVLEFLADVRSGIQNQISIEEAASLLDITPRYIRLLAKQGKIELTRDGKVVDLSLSSYLWDRIGKECALLARIAPWKLENLLQQAQR